MAKKKSSRKKRRQRKTNVPQYTPPTEPKEAAEAAPVAPVVAQPVAAATAPKSKRAAMMAGMNAIDWPVEYPFVVGDLRGMAVVTALMVALLLVLNFFLN
jgi:hypothetical protein